MYLLKILFQKLKISNSREYYNISAKRTSLNAQSSTCFFLQDSRRKIFYTRFGRRVKLEDAPNKVSLSSLSFSASDG